MTTDTYKIIDVKYFMTIYGKASPKGIELLDIVTGAPGQSDTLELRYAPVPQPFAKLSDKDHTKIEHWIIDATGNFKCVETIIPSRK